MISKPDETESDVAKKHKKISLKTAVDKLTEITEKHLSALPEEEQDARVAAFARRDFNASRAAHTRPSKTGRTRATGQLAEVVDYRFFE